MAQSVLEPSSPLSSSLSQFLSNEATKGISTPPPEWVASPSQSYSPGISSSSHFYSWVQRDAVKVKHFAQEHNTLTPPGLKLIDPESSALTKPPTPISIGNNMTSSAIWRL